MKLKGKMDHSKKDFKEIMADMNSESEPMLEALMIEANLLLSDNGISCETPEQKAERIAFMKGVLITLTMRNPQDLREYKQPSYLVERLIKTAKNEHALFMFSKTVREIVGCRCKRENHGNTAKAEVIKLDKEGNSETMSMDDLPPEVLKALEDELAKRK